jgi:hypothetical protein
LTRRKNGFILITGGANETVYRKNGSRSKGT